MACLVTARKRSLGQGNIFISVCQEFCPQRGRGEGGLVSQHALLQGGGIPAYFAGGIPACRGRVSRSTPKGEVEGSGQEGSPGPYRGVYPSMHWGRPPWTATATGGTHPTGMHSCTLNLCSDCKIRQPTHTPQPSNPVASTTPSHPGAFGGTYLPSRRRQDRYRGCEQSDHNCIPVTRKQTVKTTSRKG